MQQEAPPYRAIWDLLKRGQVVPVLGPGIAAVGRPSKVRWSPTQPEFLPISSEIAYHLASEVNLPAHQESELTEIAQIMRVMLGRPLLRERLHSIFAQNYRYTALHEFIASVPANQLIMTTTYDDLLEQAFRAQGYPFDLIIYPSDNEEWRGAVLYLPHGAAEAEPFAPNKLFINLNQTTAIFKLHGTVNSQDASLDSFVIDEDDCSTFLTRVASKKAIPAIFAAHIRTRYLLYIGYSLHDWSARLILSQLEKDILPVTLNRLPSWAIQKDVSPIERRLWEKRNTTIYDIEIGEFIDRLRAEQAARP
jgi:hypothetical protein